jgi:hypothetical protein
MYPLIMGRHSLEVSKMKWTGSMAIAICGLALSSLAQSVGQSASGDSAVNATQQTGASAAATSSQDAKISHKGKEDDKNAAATAATQGASNGAISANAASGAAVQAVLNKSVDAKKAKQGDEVTAKTTEDLRASSGLNIPKGSKLVGHVSEVKAYEKGKSGSMVAIVFDKALVKGGQEVPIHATIQALAAPVQMSMPQETGEPAGPPTGGGSPGQGGGLAGGAAHTAGSAVGSVADTAGGVASNTGAVAGPAVGATGANLPRNAGAGLNANSQGVIGLPDVRLSADSETSTHGSVLTSGSSNVHLDGGTRMVLRVTAQ